MRTTINLRCPSSCQRPAEPPSVAVPSPHLPPAAGSGKRATDGGIVHSPYGPLYLGNRQSTAPWKIPGLEPGQISSHRSVVHPARRRVSQPVLRRRAMHRPVCVHAGQRSGHCGIVQPRRQRRAVADQLPRYARLGNSDNKQRQGYAQNNRSHLVLLVKKAWEPLPKSNELLHDTGYMSRKVINRRRNCANPCQPGHLTRPDTGLLRRNSRCPARSGR
jgi:hypothetical protein